MFQIIISCKFHTDLVVRDIEQMSVEIILQILTGFSLRSTHETSIARTPASGIVMVDVLEENKLQKLTKS